MNILATVCHMGHTHTSKKADPKDWHNADIKAALEKQGWSLMRLSKFCGYNGNIVKHALHKPFPAGEKFIAEAIGVHPKDIWPSRYNADGTAIRPPGRPIRQVEPIKDTSSPLRRNVAHGVSK